MMNKLVNGISGDSSGSKPPQVAKRPSRAEVEQAVSTLIRWAGDDPDREGLIETPARVTRAYEQWFVDSDCSNLMRSSQNRWSGMT